MTQDEEPSLGLSIRNIEIAVKSSVPLLSRLDLKNRLQQWLESRSEELPLGKNGEIDLSFVPNEVIPQANDAIHSMRFVDDEKCTENDIGSVFPPGCPFRIHTFELSQEEISVEEIEPTGGDDEWTAGCDNLTLPHVSLDGLWENLIYDSSVKHQLLKYAQSAMLFSDRRVSEHIVHWNRILLLHGVPGTGKTSLCRALAHKLAIRLSDRFPRSTLLEIHSHSLFSKWFSTSGKLVSALFSMVRDMVEDDPDALVCVLIDEVESLASSRSNTGGGDPSDAMRAVNSLLTSLDRLKSFPNVLILATTNITGQIDAAFVDRVDLKLHIGLPILRARYEILKTCLEELVRVGIVSEATFAAFGIAVKEGGDDVSNMLLACARNADGMSGRSLRRLPLQAHAQFLGVGGNAVSGETFLRALSCAIASEKKARSEL